MEFDGGFINFPSAAYSADPLGVIRRPSGQNLFSTVATPTLNGSVLFGLPFSGVPFYDAAVRRWVPANVGQSSSDGLHYAYTTADAQGLQIHIVDVRSAADKTYQTDLPTWNFVADYDSGIVYLTGTAIGGPGIGIWAFNPATGTSRQLSTAFGVLAIRGGYAWIGRFDPRDQTPQGYSELPSINTIVRIALASGAETVWYYHPGQYLDVTGFDARGAPVITVPYDQQPNDAAEFRLVERPGTSGRVISQGGIRLGPPQGDRDRLWFGGPNGIYFYSSTRGLIKVFNFNGNDNLNIYPVGYCV
jgi:hypothetical protein